MYTLTLQNVAGPEADIAKARFYINGAQVAEVDAAPGASVTADVQWPDSGPITVETSFVDAAGNESLRRSDDLIIPDKAAPQAPGTATRLTAVVWTGA